MDLESDGLAIDLMGDLHVALALDLVLQVGGGGRVLAVLEEALDVGQAQVAGLEGRGHDQDGAVLGIRLEGVAYTQVRDAN